MARFLLFRLDEFNYVGAKLLARKEKKEQDNAKPSPEEAAVRYYREFVDASLQRHIGVSSE